MRKIAYKSDLIFFFNIKLGADLFDPLYLGYLQICCRSYRFIDTRIRGPKETGAQNFEFSF
jgi:hypothetical protein